MKKTLVALAAMAATGAFAQVTIYGTVDLGLVNKKVDNAGTITKTTDLGDDRASTHGEGVSGGSRLGFSAAEDLGNGMKADVTVEMALFPSEKANYTGGSAMRVRQAWVGLTSGAGYLQLGRVYTPMWATQGSYDFGGGNNLYGWNGANSNSGNRQANAIHYTSPSFSGFQVLGMVGLGESVLDSSVAAGAAKSEKLDEVTSIGLSYRSGPLSANFAWEATKNHTFHDLTFADASGAALNANLQLVGVNAATTAPNASPDTVVTGLGVGYDLGVAKIAGVWSQMKIDNDTATDLAVVNKGISVGVPFGAANFFASISDSSNDAANQVKMSGYQLGVVYSLSKRTTAYAMMGDNKINNSTTNVKLTSTGFGIRHNF